jgi:hypothetical protein
MHKGTSDYEKLIDVTEVPDLGTSPELLDTTTLSDGMRTFIMGIHGSEGLEFSANYDKADFTKLKALEYKTEKYAIWFGAGEDGEPDGHEGKFSFDGQLSVRATAGGVNQVRGMQVTIAPSTEIAFS